MQGWAHSAVAVWWGYAEADPILVGFLVAVTWTLAALYVGRRILQRRRQGSRRTPRRSRGWS